MADNMTIGPVLSVGGNNVEILQTGKILVTNPKGKMKTLTQDEFKKQIIKNADKIQSGEDFEFKKDRKGLKIASAIVGTAAVVTGVIYYKKIGQFLSALFRGKVNTEAPAGYSSEFRGQRYNSLKETFKNYNGDKIVENLKAGKTAKELGLTERKTFIPNKDSKSLIQKQKNYMSERNIAKRKERLIKLLEKFGQ